MPTAVDFGHLAAETAKQRVGGGSRGTTRSADDVKRFMGSAVGEDLGFDAIESLEMDEMGGGAERISPIKGRAKDYTITGASPDSKGGRSPGGKIVKQASSLSLGKMGFDVRKKKKATCCLCPSI